MLVEDNQSDIELTKRAFLKHHISNELLIAHDGQEALDYLFATDTSPMPAVVLLDLKLPRVDGLEVLRRIRDDERTRRLPVVILTSSKEEPDVIKSYDLGVNSYIRKPVDFVQFSNAIQTLGLYWLVLNESPPQRSKGPEEES
jgi:CheY-like chemotaxis protein